MAKDKKEKPVLNLDDKEYVIEDMTDEQKIMVQHINDLQNKQNTNAFVRQQLVECEKVFVDKHQKGVMELKKALEPEVVEAEEE